MNAPVPSIPSIPQDGLQGPRLPPGWVYVFAEGQQVYADGEPVMVPADTGD